MGNSSVIGVVPGIFYIWSCKFHTVPTGEYFVWRGGDPTKLRVESWKFKGCMVICVCRGGFFRQLWGWGINKARVELLLSGNTRSREFIIRGGSWRHVHGHRVRGATISVAWVGLGDKFGQTLMNAILSCLFPITLNPIWNYVSNGIESVVDLPEQSLDKVSVLGYKKHVISDGLLPHECPSSLVVGPSIFASSG